MRSESQERYRPDRHGSRTGGPLQPNSKVSKKFGWLLPFVHWQFLICSVWPQHTSWSVWSGHYPHFGLFGQVNTHISVSLVWPIPTLRSVWSGQYAHLVVFGLCATHIQGPDEIKVAPLQNLQKSSALTVFQNNSPSLVSNIYLLLDD